MKLHSAAEEALSGVPMKLMQIESKADSWHAVANVEEIASPALLVYPARVQENIQRMLRIAGDPQRLRPHMKTHKLPEVIRMQLAQGITRFKCATIAEAEMTANCGAPNVLLGCQPVGPNVWRLIQLAKTFPEVKFSTIADDADAVRALSAAAAGAGLRIRVLLDLDCGMHRSGIAPGAGAAEIYRLMSSLPGLEPGGFHAYDGHIHDRDAAIRAKACEAAFAPVQVLREEVSSAGMLVPTVVAGGTPTFPMHARRPDVECSPGTCVFWDFGYATKLPDVDFLPAALLLTRVISKPGPNRLCLDLGHKAVASENPHPRVQLLEVPDAKAVSHSEEHLVIETARADEFAVGSCLYGIPWHVCPTVALHSEVVVVKNGRAETKWRIVARERKLTI